MEIQNTQATPKPKKKRYYRPKKKTVTTENTQLKAQQPAQPQPKKSRAPQQKKKTEQPQVAQAPQQNAVSKPNNNQNRRRKPKTPAVKFTQKLRVIPLGGLDEVGKNMTIIEYGNDIMLVDSGMAFPTGDMLGIDLVIPDMSYLEKNVDKFRGIVLTHGHEDHIGSLPYLLKKMNVPVYGTRLTLGILRNKLEEHRLLAKAKLNERKDGDIVKLGCFEVEFIHVNHSIPDAVGFAIKTPVGTLVFTGDFKFDSTPIQGEMIDLARFGELGRQGVLAMFSDSTNAERAGFTMSEKIVGESFNNLFKGTKKRIVVATFASNIHRVQQIIDAAVLFDRKVAISGRSMENNVKVAIELGVMNVPEGVLVELNTINRYTPEQLVLISTGSQGEPMAALSRMASSDHKKVEIGPDDMVIISATPIPGNEKMVGKVINELLKLGAEVVYEKLRDIHVSGHACQEELKMMIALVKPKFFIPIHGELRQTSKHAMLAKQLGYTNENIILFSNGNVLELTPDSAKLNGSVPSGVVLIDGSGVGDVGNIVLRDRKLLSEDGLFVVVVSMEGATGQVVSGPDIVSRGFVYVRESEAMMEGARKLITAVLDKHSENYHHDWQSMKNDIKDALGAYLYSKTKRRPMVLPIIMEI